MRWAIYIQGGGKSEVLKLVDLPAWMDVAAQLMTIPGATAQVADGVTLGSHYVDGDILTARQHHPDLPVSTVATGVALAGLPVGATATAFAPGGAEVGSAVIDPDGALVLPTAGQWRVAIAPSVTHFARDYLIEVT